MDLIAVFYSHVIFVLLITHYTRKIIFPISQMQIRILFIICSLKIFCIEGFPDEILTFPHKKEKSVLPNGNIHLISVDSH